LILAGLLAGLTIAHVITVWEVLVLSFLSAAANSVDQPTRNALIPDLVPEQDLMNAISLNSVTFQGAALVGPAIAGVLVAVIGFGGVFLINAFSFLAVVWALYLMRAVSQHERKETSLRQELGAGISFVARTPLILSLLLMTGLFSIFGRSYTTLMPAFAKDVLHLHASGLGLLYSAPGLGTIVGGFILAASGDIRRKGTLLLAGALIVSGLLVAFALTPQLLPALLLLAGVGAMTTVYSATNTTLLQINAPGPMRGRVMSYNTVALLGLAPLGGGISGFIAEVVGVRESLLLGAVIVAVVTVAFYWMTPHIRAQNRPAGGSAPASHAAH
jgi:MFS family permease